MSDKHYMGERLASGDSDEIDGLDGLGLEGTLTLKQSRFIDAYIATGNGAKAAIEAGYSEATAREMAHENLTKPHIVRVIADRLRAAAVAAGVTAAAVVAELHAIATADATEHCRTVIDSCRYCHGFEHRYSFTPAEYRRALDKALSEGQAAPEFEGGMAFDPRREPHPDCPECAGRGVVTVIIRPSREVSPAARRLLASVKQNKDGSVELKMHDQMKALELLGRYAGAFKDVSHISGPNGGPLMLQPVRPDFKSMSDAELAQFLESKGCPLVLEAGDPQ
jgi:phage terminase small subunit